MTALHHIYAIKNLLSKGTSSDDFPYSDRFILHLLDTSRAYLLERKLASYSELSPQAYHTICLPLEESNYQECCDIEIPQTCTFYKSTIPLPKTIGRIAITDITGKPITKKTIRQQKLTTLTPKPKITYFIKDGYLYVVSPSKLKLLLATAVFESFSDIAPLCKDACSDPFETEYGIDSDLTVPMYEMVLKIINSQRERKDETTNARHRNTAEEG